MTDQLQADWIPDAEFVRASKLMDLPNKVVNAVPWIGGLVLAYAWLTFTLRRFPYSAHGASRSAPSSSAS